MLLSEGHTGNEISGEFQQRYGLHIDTTFYKNFNQEEDSDKIKLADYNRYIYNNDD